MTERLKRPRFWPLTWGENQMAAPAANPAGRML